MWNKITILHNTICYLRPIQIFYQIVYRFKRFLGIKKIYNNKYSVISQLDWVDGIYHAKSFFEEGRFKFLNQEFSFNDEITWNYSGLEKLWNYNLNYFDYLNQREIKKEDGLYLMNHFASSYGDIRDGKEPYPTSLRIVNWIKYISKNNINSHTLNKIIKEDSERLISNLEYHLLGNHLFENGCALFFSAFYFDDKRYLNKSLKILTNELDVQILNDGAHFELSPMYHQVILFRLLDCIKLIKLNSDKVEIDILQLFQNKASLMISWLKQITFSNGSIPLLNDSAENIYPDSIRLIEYSEKLNVKKSAAPLSDSGYRVIKNVHYELLIDVGEIGAEYQPAHAHADTFNFLLNVKGKPLIVDAGISTYNNNEQRSLERSTESHNTVTVNGVDSSEVWGNFRVGKRAKIIELLEDENYIQASHNGYKKLNIIHQRSWQWKDDSIIINDKLIGKESIESKAHFHFHPDLDLSYNNNSIRVNEELEIEFPNAKAIKIKDYKYSSTFNRPSNALCAEVSFVESLATHIKINV